MHSDGSTDLRLDTSGDQYRVSCPQFAVAVDTSPSPTTELAVAFYHQSEVRVVKKSLSIHL
jgi:hypothetical protein